MRPNRIAWDHVAGIHGTLVCFAAARQVETITRSLVAHGRAPEEAAVLDMRQDGSRSFTIEGSLGDIAQRAIDGPLPCWWSARSRTSASTCAGSTPGRCSAAALS